MFRRDRFSVGLADQVTCLHLRSGGHLEKLLHRRLRDSHHVVGSVRVGVRTIASDSAAVHLMEAGAVGWYDTSNTVNIGGNSSSSDDICTGASGSFLTLEELLKSRSETLTPNQWPYLVHCTRAANGPWPDETTTAWRDRILLGNNRSDELYDSDSAIAVLARIWKQKVIWGTSRVTRGTGEMVCLSATPLSQLLASRIYRSHLGRWDYEPFGIAIRRTVAEGFGARPVIYGDSHDFNKLHAADKPWFQSRGTRYDWTTEQEWRVANKLRLSDVPEQDMFVFVPDQESARKLRSRFTDLIIVCLN